MISCFLVLNRMKVRSFDGSISLNIVWKVKLCFVLYQDRIPREWNIKDKVTSLITLFIYLRLIYQLIYQSRILGCGMIVQRWFDWNSLTIDDDCSYHSFVLNQPLQRFFNFCRHFPWLFYYQGLVTWFL